MIIAENKDELMQIKKSSISNEILFEGLKFVFIREDKNVIRVNFVKLKAFLNLTAIHYRNEKENKNLILFFNKEVMELIETSYSVN